MAEHLLRVAHRAQVRQRRRQEGLHALHVDDEAALDRGGHRAAHARLLRVGLAPPSPSRARPSPCRCESITAGFAAPPALITGTRWPTVGAAPFGAARSSTNSDERDDVPRSSRRRRRGPVLRDGDDLDPRDLALGQLLGRGGLLREQGLHRLLVRAVRLLLQIVFDIVHGTLP